MDGLQRAAGVGPTIELGGTTYQVQCRILEHHALISAEIAKARGNPFDMIRDAREALGDDKELVAQIVTRIIYESRDWRDATIDEIGRWIAGTWAGQCFAVWLSIKENDPQTLTLEHVTQLLSREYEARTKRDGALQAEKWLDESINGPIQAASGEDELGNSTGSPPSPEGKASETATSGAPAERETASPGT